MKAFNTLTEFFSLTLSERISRVFSIIKTKANAQCLMLSVVLGIILFVNIFGVFFNLNASYSKEIPNVPMKSTNSSESDDGNKLILGILNPYHFGVFAMLIVFLGIVIKVVISKDIKEEDKERVPFAKY